MTSVIASSCGKGKEGKGSQQDGKGGGVDTGRGWSGGSEYWKVGILGVAP